MNHNLLTRIHLARSLAMWGRHATCEGSTRQRNALLTASTMQQHQCASSGKGQEDCNSAQERWLHRVCVPNKRKQARQRQRRFRRPEKFEISCRHIVEYIKTFWKAMHWPTPVKWAIHLATLMIGFCTRCSKCVHCCHGKEAGRAPNNRTPMRRWNGICTHPVSVCVCVCICMCILIFMHHVPIQ
jgi:hypothetical protein